MFENVSRRNFVQGAAAAGAGIAASAALVGMGTAIAEETTASAPEASYTPGVYTATTRGRRKACPARG